MYAIGNSSAHQTTAALSVGDRAPDATLRTADDIPVRLFDLYRGPQFTAVWVPPLGLESNAYQQELLVVRILGVDRRRSVPVVQVEVSNG